MACLFDPATYTALSSHLQARANETSREHGLRAWVVGCGTGEDAYATAILLYETMAQLGAPGVPTVFATESDAKQLAAARTGTYAPDRLAGLSPAQRQHFFTAATGHYQVTGMLRERVIFAAHRLLGDPPFGRLNLVICCAPLAELTAAQQASALERFAFGLQPDGLLLLGEPLVMPGADARFQRADHDRELYLRTSAPVQPPAARVRERGLLFAPRTPQEELRTGNDELLVINEELRSMTEELAVRGEELQTLNEQLQTINQHQEQTLTALARTSADLENLIRATDIGVMFLDDMLQVQRYTAPVLQIINLLPVDIGRPLADLTHQLRYDELLDDSARVLVAHAPIEHEAQHADGRWFLVRLRPYCSTDDQITGVALTFLDINERKQAEQALRRSNAELELRVQARTIELTQAHAARQALLHELVQAQESERLRIARELHDTFGQQITAILLGLQLIKEQSHGRAETLAQLEHVWEIIQTMGRNMHEVAISLRPTALDDIGLAGALHAYVEGWSRRAGVAAQLFVTGVERKSLPPEVESTIYRVAQEALTNVVRHAGASHVSVILESDGRRIVAIIEDNGRGFEVEHEPPNQQTRLGLLGMQERVALVGGTLTIESELGAGTTVIARIPLARAKEADDGGTANSAR